MEQLTNQVSCQKNVDTKRYHKDTGEARRGEISALHISGKGHLSRTYKYLQISNKKDQ